MNEAIYCRNGHFIDYDPKTDPMYEYRGAFHDWQIRQVAEKRKRLAFCPECGAAAVKACEQCKTVIDRDPIYSSRPAYCPSCGKAFPWTEISLAAAKEFASELEELDAEEKATLSVTFDDLTVDTPRTELAVHRLKKFLKKIGPQARNALYQIALSIGTAEAKKKLGLP